MIIRPASLTDLPAIFKIDRTVFGELPYPLFVLRQFLDFSPDYFVVLEHDTVLAGYALGSFDSTVKTGWILSVGVLPEFQGNGFGKALTSFLVAQFRKSGAVDVRLTAVPEKRAIVGMYQKLGFEVLEQVENYFFDGEKRLVMRKMPI